MFQIIFHCLYAHYIQVGLTFVFRMIIKKELGRRVWSLGIAQRVTRVKRVARKLDNDLITKNNTGLETFQTQFALVVFGYQ